MGEFVLWETKKGTYAARADIIDSIELVESSARFDSGGALSYVSTVMRDRIVFLVDVPALLGDEPIDVEDNLCALITAPEEKTIGFVVRGAAEKRDINAESILQLPNVVVSPAVREAVVVQRKLIPIIDLKQLYQSPSEAPGARTETPRQTDVPPAATERIDDTSHLRRITVGAETLCAATPDLQPVKGTSTPTARNPLTTGRVDTIAYINDKVIPIHDLARAFDERPTSEKPRLMVATVDEAEVGFAVDKIGRQFPDGSAQEIRVPPLLASGSVHAAIQYRSNVYPIVDLAALARGAGTTVDIDAARNAHAKDLAAEADLSVVVPVRIGGTWYALPKNEIEDAEQSIKVGLWVHARRIVPGTVTADSELIPFVDLAAYLGRATDPEKTQRLLLMRKAGFRSAIHVEEIGDERSLSPDDAQPLPPEVPTKAAYGCYLDGDSVTLILNVAAIAFSPDEEAAEIQDPALVGRTPKHGIARTAGAWALGTGIRGSKASVPASDTPPTGPAPDGSEDETTADAPPNSPAPDATTDEPSHEPTDSLPASPPETPADTSATEDHAPAADVQQRNDESPAATEGRTERPPDESATDASGDQDHPTSTPANRPTNKPNGVPDKAAASAAAAKAPDGDSTTPHDDELVAEPVDVELPEVDRSQWKLDDSVSDPSKLTEDTRTPSAELPNIMPSATEERRLNRRGRKLFAILLLAAALLTVGILFGSRITAAVREAWQSLTADRVGRVNETGEPGAAGPNRSEAGGADNRDTVQLSRLVYFEPNSAQITPQADQELRRLASTIHEIGQPRITVTGHTALWGTPESCQLLSEERARAVKRRLTELTDTDPTDIAARGVGAEEPMGDNTTMAGRSRNRRVEIDVVTQGSP